MKHTYRRIVVEGTPHTPFVVSRINHMRRSTEATKRSERIDLGTDMEVIVIDLSRCTSFTLRWSALYSNEELGAAVRPVKMDG